MNKLFIIKTPVFACDLPFSKTPEALKYAKEHPEELDPSDNGYQVIMQHSEVFTVEEIKQTKLVFTNRETIETT